MGMYVPETKDGHTRYRGIPLAIVMGNNTLNTCVILSEAKNPLYVQFV